MKRPLATFGSLALIAVLTVAAFTPEATYRVLSTPDRWIDAKKTADRKAVVRARWSETRGLAGEGDADAMYRLGLQMRQWSNEEWTGIRSDSAAGEALIRSAANANNVNAMLTVWTMDSLGVDDLVRISDVALEQKTHAYELGGISGFLRWKAIEGCHVGARDAAGRVHEAASAGFDGATRAGEGSRYAEFRASFDKACTVG